MNIFKTVALAMLMPAMLLTTACSSEDDLTNNTVNSQPVAKKGYALPVTVSATREGDKGSNRASYNESTRKLEFSTGDKLFVEGSHIDADRFAGTLDYDAGSGKFSGTIYTESEYTGTIDDLMASARATLLPAGYGSYGFFSIEESGSDAWVDVDRTKAFALTKAAAVEQFSLEQASTYSSGFALAPQNAIASFTISGLTANKKVTVSFGTGLGIISGNVTTNATGVATFAVGMSEDWKLEECTLTVDGNDIAMPTKTVVPGHIYNISRNALIVNPAVGQVIGDDGKNYADAAAATSAGATAVAVIAYVGSDTKDATFKNGLAIALADEGEMRWSPAKSTCEGKTAITGAKWCLPSEGQWTQMFAANGGNGGSYTGLNTTITNAGGTTLREGGYYWSSSEEGATRAWFVELHSDGSAEWWFGSKDNSDVQARACLAF